MIQLRKRDDNTFYLKYVGELCDKHKMLRLLAVSFNLSRRIDADNWIIDNKVAELLATELPIEYINVPWENIGQGLKYTPYDYQKEAAYFILNNNSSLQILGTGFGKTFLAIIAYNELKLSNKVSTPGLIVVPASLKYQWVKEVSKFSDLVAHSIDSPSKMKKKFDAQFEDCDLFICNYESLKNQSIVEKIKEKQCEFICCDEIQKINNYKSGIHKAICKFDDIKYKIGMSATPLTNNPENVFGIFNFIEPKLFKSHGKFASNYIIYKGYGIVGGVKNVEHLKQQIKPYIFMKSEEDIGNQLPELIITPIYCQMDNKTKKIHDEIMTDLDTARKAAEAIENKITNPKLLESNEEYQKYRSQILAYQTFAQELANHCSLLSMSESKMANKYSVEGTNSKLDVLLELVEQIIESGETVCIFTRFERMQRLINQALNKKYKDIGISIINGSMSKEERFKQVEQFKENEQYKIIILTDAGNSGISLSNCKNLIEYEPALSYADQTQRRGRIKRADSVSRISNIYQLIMSNSYDEIQLKIINKKMNYDTDIIQNLK